MPNNLLKFALLFLICITHSYGANNNELQRIYIQKNGVLISLEKAILQMDGHVSQIENTRKYNIILQNKNYSLNFSPMANPSKLIDFFVGIIVPNNVKVNLSFTACIPGDSIYWDNNDTGIKINADGYADITTLYPEKGHHRIELRKNNRINAKDQFNISSQSTIICKGLKKLKCNFL